MDYFLETLKLSTKRIATDFEATKQVWHNASAGMLREKVIKDILKPYLPDCYGISGGLCYDYEENKSRQLDIILYDSLFSYRLPFGSDFIVFPCESVYGNIEVKTTLNKDTIKESIENIASLKRLKRKDATEFDITPHLELTITGQHLGTKKNNYFGVVFSYQSSEVETIMKNLSECSKPNDVSLLPDMFILLDKHTIVYKADKLSNNINLCGSAEGYVPVLTGEDTLAYFLITILTILYGSHLKSINPGSIFVSDIIGNNEKSANWSLFIPLK